ncbi:M48 family metalloprotease [Streptomyces sp. NPDC005526]|uniref:M48 family metalloprotease n=1 Tax=Streptomyces sp. NPDC005526 TaxID=3156885 RepID=UPI0033BC2B06
MSQSPDPAVPPPGPSHPVAEPPRYDTTGPVLPYPGTVPPQYAAEPEPPYPAAPMAAPAYPDALTGAAPHSNGSAATAPPYPDAAMGAPAYPGDSLEAPTYPGATAGAPQYPGSAPSAGAPPYPDASTGVPVDAGESAGAPPYPSASAGAPGYRGATAAASAGPAHQAASPAAPPYPGTSATTPPYPGTSAATASPPYPEASATTAPPYPNTPAGPPTYPGADPLASGAAPTHPGGTPPYPGGAQPYPGTGPGPGHPAGGPAHPGTAPAHPQAATPPPPGVPSQAPFGAANAATAAPAAPPVPEPSVAPDDLDYRHRGSRVLVAEHQRGADATAIGRLAVQVPGFLVSLAVVSSIALGVFGDIAGTVVLLAWLASGALVFHRPTELAFARHVLKLRPPTPDERARLEPVWREVTARAGVEAHTYELMVENSDELNAVAAAGHVVGVTTYSLNRIPSSNLAAVLAHELGHHTGGHAWAGLLGYWYSLPGRVAWAFMRGMARIALAVSRVLSLAATGFLYLFLGITVVAGFLTMWYVTVPLVAAPYLLAHMGRRGELRADQQAAELGFARHLAEVLHHFRTEEAAAKAAAEAQGQKLQDPGTLSRLLSSHPDHQTRLTALEPYLRLHR